MRVEISFVVCTYMRAEDLRRCLTSIVSLPDTDIEIIVSDNASPDHTPEVIASFSGDSRVKADRHHSNLGLQRNYLHAIGRATGKYLFILTDDDALVTGAFPALRTFLKCHPEAALVLSPIVDKELGVGPVIARSGPAIGLTIFPPGAKSAALVARWSSVLSRQVIRADTLDMDFLSNAVGNAYFPCAVAAHIAARHPTGYLDQDLVIHSVGNVQHWNEFGKNWREVYFRTHMDYCRCLELALDSTGLRAPIVRARWWLHGLAHYARVRWDLGLYPFLWSSGVHAGLAELSAKVPIPWWPFLFVYAAIRGLRGIVASAWRRLLGIART